MQESVLGTEVALHKSHPTSPSGQLTPAVPSPPPSTAAGSVAAALLRPAGRG